MKLINLGETNQRKTRKWPISGKKPGTSLHLKDNRGKKDNKGKHMMNNPKAIL